MTFTCCSFEIDAIVLWSLNWQLTNRQAKRWDMHTYYKTTTILIFLEKIKSPELKMDAKLNSKRYL